MREKKKIIRIPENSVNLLYVSPPLAAAQLWKVLKLILALGLHTQWTFLSSWLRAPINPSEQFLLDVTPWEWGSKKLEIVALA